MGGFSPKSTRSQSSPQQRVFDGFSSEKVQKYFFDTKNVLPVEISTSEISTVLPTSFGQKMAFFGRFLKEICFFWSESGRPLPRKPKAESGQKAVLVGKRSTAFFQTKSRFWAKSGFGRKAVDRFPPDPKCFFLAKKSLVERRSTSFQTKSRILVKRGLLQRTTKNSFYFWVTRNYF